jgi:hypothetical protein
MESPDKFDIEASVEAWIKRNCSIEEFTPGDIAEMRSNMFIAVEDIIKEHNLNEEEAFAVAKVQKGDAQEWQGEMKVANEDNFQLRKIILIFSGFMLYVFSYNFILCLNRIIFFVSNHVNGDTQGALDNAKTFFYLVYALSISVIVAMFFLHQPVKWLMHRATINVKRIVLAIIAVAIVVTLENYLIPQIAKEIKDVVFRTVYYNLERYFKYVYSFIIGVGYVVIFLRFSKKYYC